MIRDYCIIYIYTYSYLCDPYALAIACFHSKCHRCLGIVCQPDSWMFAACVFPFSDDLGPRESLLIPPSINQDGVLSHNLSTCLHFFTNFEQVFGGSRSRSILFPNCLVRPSIFSQDRGKYTYANGDEFMGLWDKGNKLSGTFYYRVWAPQSFEVGMGVIVSGWRFFCFWNLVQPYLVPSIFGWVETTNYKNKNNLGGRLDNHDICRVVSTTCRCHAVFFPVFDFLRSTLFQQECKDDQKVTPKCWEIQPAQKIEDLRVHNMDRWTIPYNSPFSLMIFPFQPPFCSGFSTSYSWLPNYSAIIYHHLPHCWPMIIVLKATYNL